MRRGGKRKGEGKGGRWKEGRRERVSHGCQIGRGWEGERERGRESVCREVCREGGRQGVSEEKGRGWGNRSDTLSKEAVVVFDGVEGLSLSVDHRHCGRVCGEGDDRREQVHTHCRDLLVLDLKSTPLTHIPKRENERALRRK